jgi:hypothetical protein
MRIPRSVVLAIGVTLAVPVLPPAQSAGSGPATHHFIANLDGATRPHRLGYDIFDTGASRAAIAALPRGVKAMVWLGQKCPTAADDSFRATVRRLARNSRVFGYFLSDEPHLSDCPGGPAALATRTAFIRAVSSGRQRSFIVLEHEDYQAFRPAVTGASLVGIDSYPCSVNGCRYSKIKEKVTMARSAGIPLGQIVPVFQAFGQEGTGSGSYYRMPTARQEHRILATWAAAVPHPVMDYTYGWRHQSSANPTLADSRSLQRVLKSWFAR